MSLKTAEVASLLAATITTGLMAGVFGVFAHTIMRGLHTTDDRTFVGAFQAIDRAIINPLFMLTFFGALVASGTAGVLYLRDDDRSVLPWIVAAFALYLVVVVITMAVHVPLNDDIKAAGNPERIADLGAVRDAFHETRWVAWNIVRALATTLAFGCLAWGLVLHGRMTSTVLAAPAAAEVRATVPSGVPGPPASWTVRTSPADLTPRSPSADGYDNLLKERERHNHAEATRSPGPGGLHQAMVRAMDRSRPAHAIQVTVADGTVAGSGYDVIALDDNGRILLDHQHIAPS